MKKVFELLIVLLAFLPGMYAQYLPVEVLNVENKLPFSDVSSVSFDGRHLAWITSYGKGVAVFNGNKTIAHYTTENGLQSNYVVTVNAVGDSVFIVQDKYLSLWYRNAFSRLPVPRLNSGEELAGVFVDSRQQLWLTTDAGKIVKYTAALDTFAVFDASQTMNYTDYLFNIAEDSQGNIWFGALEGNIIIYDKTKDIFIDGMKKFDTDFINVYDFLPTDSCMYVSAYAGFYKITDDTVQNLIVPGKAPFFTEKALYFQEVNRVNGKLYGFSMYGVAEIIIHANYLEVPRDYSTTEGLPLYSITGMTTSPDNELWLATGHGVVRIPAFDVWEYSTTQLIKGYLANDVTNLEKGQGNDVLFEAPGFLFVLNDSSLTPQTVWLTPDSFSGSDITKVFPLDSNYNRMWLATISEGMVYVDKEKDIYHKYCQCQTRWSMSVIIEALRLGNDSFMVVGQYQWALFYDTTYHFIHITKDLQPVISLADNDSSAFIDIQYIYDFRKIDNRIFLATSAGLFIWENGKITRWNLPGLNTSIERVVKDRNGYFWLLTTDKLYRYHETDNTLKDFTHIIHPSLKSQYHDIYFRDNDLWIDNSQRIILDSRSEPQKTELYVSNRLNYWIGQVEYEPVVAGQSIYLASNEKVIRAPLSLLRPKETAPNVVVFSAYNYVDSTYFYHSPTFEPEENTLEINAFVVDYTTRPENIILEYTTVVDGDTARWIAKDARRQSFLLSNLPSGNYQVLFRARYIDSQQYSPVQSVAFTILPHWYQTGWFYGIIILLFVSGISGYFHFKTQQAQKRNAIEKQIALLQVKALQAQMNPHFIFNTLNTVQYHILEGDNEATLTLLSQFSKLIRETFTIVGEKEISLEKEIRFLTQYLEIEQTRFDHTFNFVISVDEKINTHTLKIPPLLLQPFVENAILHAFKDIDKPLLEIRFSLSGNRLICIIKDNGKGFTSTTPNQEVHAIEITNKRIEKLNALNTKRLFDVTIDSSPKGTTVTLSFNI